MSVVVCAYAEERWQDLCDAVESLGIQTRPPLEVIVVVDHNPALLERVRDTLHGAVAVENEEENGLSGARNSGVQRARGEIIAFLDDDAVASPDWLERLCGHYADARVVGVGGRAVPEWLEGRPSFFPDEFDWVVGCTYRGMPESVARVRNPIGANMSFRAEALRRAGGFRSGIGRVGSRPVGCEETELSIRAASAGPEHIVLYDPDALVRHRVPAARGRWRYFRARCYSEGLSKAIVSDCVGQDAALSAERSYATRTLPLGILRGVGEGLRGDLGGVRRASAIAAGLLITAAGYAKGRLLSARAGRGRIRRAGPLVRSGSLRTRPDST